MKIKFYKRIHTDEIVYDDEAFDYVLNYYGLKIDKNKVNLDEFKDAIVECYFSCNWIEEWESVV